jgi:hypothetical protein
MSPFNRVRATVRVQKVPVPEFSPIYGRPDPVRAAGLIGILSQEIKEPVFGVVRHPVSIFSALYRFRTEDEH